MFYQTKNFRVQLWIGHLCMKGHFNLSFNLNWNDYWNYFYSKNKEVVQLLLPSSTTIHIVIFIYYDYLKYFPEFFLKIIKILINWIIENNLLVVCIKKVAFWCPIFHPPPITKNQLNKVIWKNIHPWCSSAHPWFNSAIYDKKIN